MKRLLCLIITLSTILSFPATSSAKVNNEMLSDEATEILCDLGIVKGFTDGELHLDEFITRAQFSALMVRAFNYELNAQEAQENKSICEDLSSEHWANGYINVLQALQIVQGFANGYFYPDTQITYSQAIKMLVVGIGYEEPAREKGRWPEGYMKVADEAGITKGVSYAPDEILDRRTALTLLYNCMHVRMMDSICHYSWNEPYKSDDTIFTQYWDLYRWEGSVSRAENGEIILTDARYTKCEDGVLREIKKDAVSLDWKLIPHADMLCGKKVIAYIDIDDATDTGKYSVRALRILN